MIGLLCFVLAVLASPFKSKLRLEAENAVLRHQLIVLRRRLPGRVRITTELRALIRRMSVENPLWGAPRIHGELLKLGFEVAQSSVAKYMVKRRGPPSQGWRTFLCNHAPDIAAMDLFVVPTLGFDLLYAFVIVRLDRRDLVWINVTANPTAEWVARQMTEAFPWDEAPRHLIRDRDRIYGSVVTRRLRAMGIRDKPTAPASPWQNAFAERLIGSIRCDLTHTIITTSERICHGQRRAGFSPGSADRNHQFTRDTWWTSPSLRPGLGFWYTHRVNGVGKAHGNRSLSRPKTFLLLANLTAYLAT
jgi:hypothetical protein